MDMLMISVRPMLKKHAHWTRLQLQNRLTDRQQRNERKRRPNSSTANNNNNNKNNDYKQTDTDSTK